MPRQGKSKTFSKKIALGGVLGALAVLCMLMGNILPFASFAAPVFAGVLLLPIAIELGTKFALLVYVSVSLLSLFLVTDREIPLYFILLFGYYPVVQTKLQKIKNKILRTLLKLLICNAAVAINYLIMLVLLANTALLLEFNASPLWFWGLLLVFGNIVFLVYDVMVSRLRFVYRAKFEGKLFH